MLGERCSASADAQKLHSNFQKLCVIKHSRSGNHSCYWNSSVFDSSLPDTIVTAAFKELGAPGEEEGT